MTKSKITGLHISLKSRPRKLVFERRAQYHERIYHVYEVRDMIDVLRKVIDMLMEEVPGFLLRLEEVDRKCYQTNAKRRRRYISRDRDELYPRSPHLTQKHSYQKDGFWIGTNFGQSGITDFIREACEASDISFGYVSKLKL